MSDAKDGLFDHRNSRRFERPSYIEVISATTEYSCRANVRFPPKADLRLDSDLSRRSTLPFGWSVWSRVFSVRDLRALVIAHEHHRDRSSRSGRVPHAAWNDKDGARPQGHLHRSAVSQHGQIKLTVEDLQQLITCRMSLPQWLGREFCNTESATIKRCKVGAPTFWCQSGNHRKNVMRLNNSCFVHHSRRQLEFRGHTRVGLDWLQIASPNVRFPPKADIGDFASPKSVIVCGHNCGVSHVTFRLRHIQHGRQRFGRDRVIDLPGVADASERETHASADPPRTGCSIARHIFGGYRSQRCRSPYRRSRRHADATRSPEAPIPFIVRGDDLRLAGHLFAISERTIGRRLLPSDENGRHTSLEQSNVTRSLGILQSARYTVRRIHGRARCKFVRRRTLDPLPMSAFDPKRTLVPRIGYPTKSAIVCHHASGSASWGFHESE
jgi:hypothetical protein